MANIYWNSTSINNYFNTSLGKPAYSFGNMYSTLNDAALIKSGSYGRLMDSYFSTVNNSDSADKSTAASQNSDTKGSSAIKNTVLDDLLSHEKKESTVKNTVLDELLSDEPRKSSITNPVLDDLLNKDDKSAEGTVVEKTASSASSSTATTYTSDATKNTTIPPTSVLDTLA